MQNGRTQRICLACLLGLTAISVSSCIYVNESGLQSEDSSWSWNNNARAERQVELSAPMTPDATFSARTNDGAVTVDGQDTDECRVLATIRTHARTQERAEELAEQIQVRLEPSSSGVTVVIDRPAVIRNAGFGVALDVVTPRRTNLELDTSDGSIHIRNIQGAMSVTTSDGDIDAGNTQGDMVLRTSDGSIRLNRVRADHLQARTSDGSVRGENIATANLNGHTSDGSIYIALDADGPVAPQIEMTTSDGGITLTTPPGLSATIDASASDGSIHTELPLTIQGRVGKSLRGTIGNGAGYIRLRTSDGSITIR